MTPPAAAPLVGSEGGLPILDPACTALIDAIDRTFAAWGILAGGVEITAPPIFPVSALEKFDVYANFPHLAVVAAPLRAGDEPAAREGEFDASALDRARWGLPTATCFGAYLFYEGRRVDPATVVTLVNRCFRREDQVDGLRRVLSFRMREIVAIGSYEHTQRSIREHSSRIERLCAALSLAVTSCTASDPFFRSEGSRALLQRVEAVKREFLVDGLAISSVNTHRNFFGERCGITLDDGTGGFAYTSCVAFGLERWASVLMDRYGTAEAARAAVEQAGAGLDLASVS